MRCVDLGDMACTIAGPLGYPENSSDRIPAWRRQATPLPPSRDPPGDLDLFGSTDPVNDISGKTAILGIALSMLDGESRSVG